MLGIVLAAISGCGVFGWPIPYLVAEVDRPVSALRMDVLAPRGVVGSQFVFDASGRIKSPLLSTRTYPRRTHPVRCVSDATASIRQETVVDNGATIAISAIYLDREQMIVSLYAFFEDYGPVERRDQGIKNQVFTVQLDDRTPVRVNLTGKPGVNENLRFTHVGPGAHSLRFNAPDPNPEQSVSLWTVTLVSGFP